jgi:FkbM family methyltransferase
MFLRKGREESISTTAVATDPDGSANSTITGAPNVLWDEYRVAAACTIHTATDNIEWMTKHSIANWTFEYEGVLEFWYSKLIPQRDGMIYDIGAHRGRHTDVFARFGRQVVAFEPIPQIREILQERCVSLPSVTVRPEALGNSVGRSVFTINRNAPEESGIKRRAYNDEAQADVITIDVELARLDDIHSPESKISFIKIDTEGGEVDILEGAVRTLSTYRPIISVEYGSPSYSVYGHGRDQLLQLAIKNRYRVFDIFGFPIDESNVERAVDAFAWDYLLLPEEDRSLVAAVSTLRLELARVIANYLR